MNLEGAPSRALGLWRPSRLAWTLWGLVMALAAVSLVIRLWNLSRVLETIEGVEAFSEILLWGVLIPAAVPAYATVGAVVASHRPENGVGWLCLALGLIFAPLDISWQWAIRVAEIAPGSLPVGVPMNWIAGILFAFQFLPFTLALLIFPDGRLPSRRWRFVAWAAVAGSVLGALASTVEPVMFFEVPNPTGIEGLAVAAEAATNVAIAVWFLTLLAAVASVFFRWRGARGSERQQLKWLAYTGTLIALALLGSLVSVLTSGLSYPTVLVAGFAIAGGTVGIPVAIGVAILKHHLYDIDLIINRTLVYGALTLCVIGIYIAVVGYLGELLRTGDLFVSLAATGVVAVLFQPLRDRLQRGVNRLMYGERDEPYVVVSRLGQRLESTLAPDAVLPTIVETVKEALKLPYAAIALEGNDAPEIAASAGKPVAEPLRLPLVYRNEPVGELLLGQRAPGEAFGPADRRLLEDLARQAGIAAHAVRLTNDLQRSRERLVAAREEERRRLRRDLHDGLGAQLAGLNVQTGVLQNLIKRDPAAADELVVELRTELRAAIADIRRLVHDLRPPALDDLGLVAALRQLAARFGAGGVPNRDGQETSNLRVVVEAPESLPPLPAAVEVAVYRIVQEALTNVVRHARTGACVVRLAVEDDVRLEVTDDGVGLPGERTTGVGLLSMRERAAELGGTCEIGAAPEGGTRVLVRLPLPGE